MICPHCRQNSATDGVCSQCRRPFSATAPGTVPMTQPAPPYGQPTQAMSPPAPLNAPPYGQPPQAAPPSAPYGSQPTMQMPPPATQQRVSLTGEVMDVPVAPPPTQAPYAGQPGGYQSTLPSLATQREMFYAEGPDAGELWEKFFAFGFPILAAGMLTAHLIPGSFLWVTLAGLALAGIAAYFVFRES